MIKTAVNLTVHGLYKILADNDILIGNENLGNGKISIVARKSGNIVFNDVIDEKSIIIKEQPIYMGNPEEYTRAKVAKYVYLKLLEQQVIRVRLPKTITA